MMCAYGFLKERLVCLFATPARRVTSSNHRSPSTDAPPAMHARPISTAAATAFVYCFLLANVIFLHERIRALGNLYNPVPSHVLEFLHRPCARPPHHHLVHRRRIAQPEVLPQAVLRSIPIPEHDLAHL